MRQSLEIAVVFFLLALPVITGCNSIMPKARTPTQPTTIIPATETQVTPSDMPFGKIDAFPTATIAPENPYPPVYPTLSPGPYPPPALTATEQAYQEYWLTQTALPSNTPEPTQTPTLTPMMMATPLLPQTRVVCEEKGKALHCTDHLLKISFEIPVEWGEIEPVIGYGETGYACDYRFANRDPASPLSFAAGGRSIDFSAGREAFITDYRGEPGELRCPQSGVEPRKCREIAPQILLYYYFPQAKSICDPGPGVIFSPLAVIYVNLPDNPAINGFVFLSKILSSSMQSEVDRIVNFIPRTPTQLKCDEEHQAEYDRKVKAIAEAIETGQVDPETEENLRWILRLAQSIRFIK